MPLETALARCASLDIDRLDEPSAQASAAVATTSVFLDCSGSYLDQKRHSDTLHFMEDLLSRVVHSPDIMGGKPCLRGMRVTVGTIVGLLAAGKSHGEILSDFPYLEENDIRAALAYAAWRTEEQELPLTAS